MLLGDALLGSATMSINRTSTGFAVRLFREESMGGPSSEETEVPGVRCATKLPLQRKRHLWYVDVGLGEPRQVITMKYSSTSNFLTHTA